MALTLRATCSALLSALGAFLFGLDIGYIAPILTCESFKRDIAGLDQPGDAIPKVLEGFIVGIFSIGCILTSFPTVSGFFLDYLGRRDSIILGAGVFLVGCLLQGLCKSVEQMLVGRFIAGMSIGLLSTVVALYQSEVAAPGSRGALTSLYQLMITFGILVAALLGAVLVHRPGGWRLSILLQAVPACCLLFGMPCLPRSPRWLAQVGRRHEARQALEQLRGDEAEAQAELEGIVSECSASTALGKTPWTDLLDSYMIRILTVGVVLQLFQQLVGMNAFMYYGPSIYASMGLDPYKYQVYTNLVNFLATFPAIMLVDVIGRRLLLVLGAAVMTCCSLLMAYVGSTYLSEGGGSMGGLVTACAIGCVWCFVGFFAATWGPAVWVYVAEIYPLSHRSRCMGICTTANWVGNYAVAQLTPVLLHSLGFGTFYVFGAFAAMATGLALWLPETSGVSLERMEGVFKRRLGLDSLKRADNPQKLDYGSVTK